jgi:hypothetical protein
MIGRRPYREGKGDHCGRAKNLAHTTLPSVEARSANSGNLTPAETIYEIAFDKLQASFRDPLSDGQILTNPLNFAAFDLMNGSRPNFWAGRIKRGVASFPSSIKAA